MGGEKDLHYARTSLIKTVEILTGNHTGKNVKFELVNYPEHTVC